MPLNPKFDRRVYTPLPIQNLSSWSVNGVRAALDEHEQGTFAGSALLAEHLLRNPRIVSALNTRVLAATGLPFELRAGDGDGRRNDSAVSKLAPHWSKVLPLPVMADLLRWTLLLGVALGELVWSVESDGQWIPRVKVWHPSLLEWREHERAWYVSTQEAQLRIEPGDGRWVLFSHTEHRPWMRGIVRCLGIEDSIRALAVRDWARFSEVHGVPMRLAKVPESAPDADKERFVNDLGAASLGAEATILANVDGEGRGFGLELIEAKDQAFDAFQHLIAQCDGDVAIAILGQTFTTESSGGVYVPQANGSGVRLDLLEADCNAMAQCARVQVTQPWARYNLGAGAVESAPTPYWNPKPPRDLAAEATTVKTLGEGLAALNGALSSEDQRVNALEYVKRFGVPLRPATAEEKADARAAADALAAGPGSGDGASGSDRRADSATAAKPARKPGGASSAAPARKSLAALDSEGASPLVEGQLYADAVADAAVARAPAALDPIVSAVLGEVEASADYDDLRRRLVSVLARVDPAKAQRLLRAAVLMAEAGGAWSVHQEV